MEYQKFVAALFDSGKAHGFEAMEVYYQKNSDFETTVFKAEVDRFSISQSAGLSFRGIIAGKMGYAYTEVLDEQALKMLVDEAIENAKAIESEDRVFIASPNEKYEEVIAYSPALEQMSKEEKIEFLKAVEAEVLALDPRIQTMAYNLYADYEVDVRITNTMGIDLSEKRNLGIAYIIPIASENNASKTGEVILMGHDFKKYDPKSVAKEAVEKTLSLLGAKTVSSKTYPVILENRCAANLLSAFSSVFNAEIVQKDLSMMKGKLEKAVASPAVTLIDDPFLEGGFGNISFDAEGTPAQKTRVITNGILTSYLHNLKTAQKDGVESTGNAAKASYKSDISIAPSNLFIQPGTDSLEMLASGIEEGLVIVDMEGLHSGLNTISGDFSLAAIGYLVENGVITRPVDQITVAGNLKDLLMNVEAVGNDLIFGLPSGGVFIGSPSLKIKGLAIAGA